MDEVAEGKRGRGSPCRNAFMKKEELKIGEARGAGRAHPLPVADAPPNCPSVPLCCLRQPHIIINWSTAAKALTGILTYIRLDILPLPYSAVWLVTNVMIKVVTQYLL
jgi:hypothetical protein